jgi:selT/selW/selH-like putative selenoprotein
VATEPRLVAGTTGTFDVAVDGKLVFSRHREGRFPDDDEIVAALSAR